MLTRMLKVTEVDGVGYRANDVVDLDDKVSAALVKAGTAVVGDENVAPGLKEGEAVSHKEVQKAGGIDALRAEKRKAKEKA